MKFYITPNHKQECERRLNRMFKKFTQKPEVTFSEVHKVQKVDTFVDEDGYSKERYMIDAIEVTIESIAYNEWKLVATIEYADKLVLMCDSKLFKSMPKQFGLDYTRCDHCGCTHTGRKKSCVIYNTITGEWMQVGSTCVNKMLAQGKYLANITEQLYRVIRLFCGCDEDEYRGGRWNVDKSYLRQAVRYDVAISYCANYIAQHGDNWQKTYWENREKHGTSVDLSEHYDEYDGQIDSHLCASVQSYVNTLEGGQDEFGEPTFNQKMKDMFVNEYICLDELYLAFFAVKGYYSTIKGNDFLKSIESYHEGEKIKFVGKLVNINYVQSTGYWEEDYYDAVLEMNGITFKKVVAHKGVFDKYTNSDGTYSFMVEVRRINSSKQYIRLGGRLSKIK